MKQLFTALAICVASNTPYSNTILTELPELPEPITEATKVALPDFSIIEIDHARKYVEEVYAHAVAVEEAQGIPTEITIAIACLETGYGRSKNAQQKNNHLGIRVYQNGKAGYRRFSSMEACFEYYTNMFNLERYAPLQELGPDHIYEDWLQVLQDCGFNHRDKYRKKVRYMIDFLKLDQLTRSAELV